MARHLLLPHFQYARSLARLVKDIRHIIKNGITVGLKFFKGFGCGDGNMICLKLHCGFRHELQSGSAVKPRKSLFAALQRLQRIFLELGFAFEDKFVHRKAADQFSESAQMLRLLLLRIADRLPRFPESRTCFQNVFQQFNSIFVTAVFDYFLGPVERRTVSLRKILQYNLFQSHNKKHLLAIKRF